MVYGLLIPGRNEIGAQKKPVRMAGGKGLEMSGAVAALPCTMGAVRFITGAGCITKRDNTMSTWELKIAKKATASAAPPGLCRLENVYRWFAPPAIIPTSLRL
jgi:Na+-translocating ferredoxin:NAD+ oxidoreductase RnfE subunit